ncbi:hypothetical protein LBMAG47_08320 [Planctomycetia bacterium]|jgi:hypothetical protein|nr:hypothetical protein LBMAG47_08320 [Planctomycetia bacterium]
MACTAVREARRSAPTRQDDAIAADHFPDVHVLATGSSMLGASARFRDTLAGRKRTVRLLRGSAVVDHPPQWFLNCTCSSSSTIASSTRNRTSKIPVFQGD